MPLLPPRLQGDCVNGLSNFGFFSHIFSNRNAFNCKLLKFFADKNYASRLLLQSHFKNLESFKAETKLVSVDGGASLQSVSIYTEVSTSGGSQAKQLQGSSNGRRCKNLFPIVTALV